MIGGSYNYIAARAEYGAGQQSNAKVNAVAMDRGGGGKKGA
jgi:hypothetical protein